MKIARVIGKVILNNQDPSYRGGRFLLAVPCKPDEAGKELSKGNSFVVFDQLGASGGDLIGYSDGGEAAAAFTRPTPCDAYNCAILDRVVWQPHSIQNTY